MRKMMRFGLALLLLPCLGLAQSGPAPTVLTCGDTTAAPGKPATLTARLMAVGGTTPVPGQAIVFRVNGKLLSGSPVATDADGLACLGYTPPSGTADLPYEALYVGDGALAASNGKGVVRRGSSDLALDLSATTDVADGAYFIFRIRVTQGASRTPAAAKSLVLTNDGYPELYFKTEADGTFERAIVLRPRNDRSVHWISVKSGSEVLGSSPLWFHRAGGQATITMTPYWDQSRGQSGCTVRTSPIGPVMISGTSKIWWPDSNGNIRVENRTLMPVFSVTATYLGDAFRPATTVRRSFYMR